MHNIICGVFSRLYYNCLVIDNSTEQKCSNRYYISEKVGSDRVLGGGRVSRAAGTDLHVTLTAPLPRARLPEEI